MAAQIFAVADAILKDIEGELDARETNYRRLSLDEKLEVLMRTAVKRAAESLGLQFGDLLPHITDFVSFGASIYERHHTMDVAKRAATLSLAHAELHSVDLGGASVPAALEIARKLCANEERLVLVAGSEVPRGGEAGIRYYREVSDALLDRDREAHTEANLIALYALLGDRMMAKEGITVDAVEKITAYYRNCALKNDRAAMHGKALKNGELKKYLAGPYATAMVAVATDHAIAIFIANETLLEKLEKQLRFSSAAQALYINAVGTNFSDKYLTRRSDFSSPAALAARRAFGRSGLNAADIDYAWIYDCFTLMLVRQAADYFSIAPHDAARMLCDGIISVGEKKIPINRQGGILNTQAAISLSAATGLLDIFAYAAEQPKARHFLFGGNGGLDAVNAVAILSREALPPLAFVELPTRTPSIAFTLRDGDEATLYATVMVRFNPGADAPFALGAFKRDDGQLFLARIYSPTMDALLEVDSLVRDQTRIVVRRVEGKPVAVLRV